jgi:hypothetical protein
VATQQRQATYALDRNNVDYVGDGPYTSRPEVPQRLLTDVDYTAMRTTHIIATNTTTLAIACPYLLRYGTDLSPAGSWAGSLRSVGVGL